MRHGAVYLASTCSGRLTSSLHTGGSVRYTSGYMQVMQYAAD